MIDQTLKLSDLDKMALDLSKARKDIVITEAKLAIAKSETAEWAFRYTVLQLYLKYNLDQTDTIDDQGNIIRTKEES
jgi:hypothetical protein